MPPPRVGATGEQEAPPHFSRLSVVSVGQEVVSCPSGPQQPRLGLGFVPILQVQKLKVRNQVPGPGLPTGKSF